MIVYRLCSSGEGELILENKGYDQIGGMGQNFIDLQKRKGSNTFNYEPYELYMHFFKSKEDVFKLSVNNYIFESYYICTYDIPDELLEEGTGKYGEEIEFKNPQNIQEFSIKSSLMKYEYLVKMEKITKTISIDELDFNPLDNYLEERYNKEDNKTKN